MINGVETVLDLQKYMKPILIIYTIISSLGNYLVYRRRKYNLAEHFVINFYIIGMVFLLTALFNLVTFYKVSDYDYIPTMLVGISYYMLPLSRYLPFLAGKPALPFVADYCLSRSPLLSFPRRRESSPFILY
jgi:hypothetical protein